MHYVRCPNGHIERIDNEQMRGDAPIGCSECDFDGTVDECDVLSRRQ